MTKRFQRTNLRNPRKLAVLLLNAWPECDNAERAKLTVCMDLTDGTHVVCDKSQITENLIKIISAKELAQKNELLSKGTSGLKDTTEWLEELSSSDNMGRKVPQWRAKLKKYIDLDNLHKEMNSSFSESDDMPFNTWQEFKEEAPEFYDCALLMEWQRMIEDKMVMNPVKV